MKNLLFYVGVVSVVAGILVFLNAVIAGLHAFSGGVSAVVWLMVASFLLIYGGINVMIDFWKHRK
jgi:uncharacterized membrane protein YkgB